MRIFQSRMRESTISKHGMMHSVAASTSASVMFGPTRSLFRRKAISASARGAIRLPATGIAAPFGEVHAIGQEAEVRLAHVQHVLHRLGGHADLLADHLLAVGEAALEEAQRDVVRIVDGDRRLALGQRRQHRLRAQRRVELIAEAFDRCLVHEFDPFLRAG